MLGRFVENCCFGLAVVGLVAVLLGNSSVAIGADHPTPLDAAATEKISFHSDVWPILKRHCWGCHSGPQAKGGLRMDTVAEMLKGGDTGPLFTAGKPEESLLIKMVSGDSPEMPQMQAPLSVAKIDILRGWILAGAKDDSPAKSTAPTILIPDVYRSPPAIAAVSLSSDGKQLVVACRSEIVLLTIDGSAPSRRLPTECDFLSHVEFSPDGQVIAAVGGSPARYGEVQFFRATDGTVIGSRRIGSDTLFRGAFSPDGKAIAVGGPDGAVHIIPLDSQAAVRSFELHSDWVLDVAYTPDGKVIVSGGRDKATKLSSVETGQLLRAVDSSTDLISSVVVDDQFAIAAGRARTLIAYELNTALSGVGVTGAGNDARPITKREQYVKNIEAQPGEVLDVAMSADRKTFAVAGAFNEVRIYRAADRQRVESVTGIAGTVYGIALNGDGTRLAIGTKSGTVQVHELPGGKQVVSLVPVPVAAVATTVSAN